MDGLSGISDSLLWFQSFRIDPFASLFVSCISPQRLFGLALGAVELKLKHFQFDFRV